MIYHLKELRTERNLSQSVVAAALGISQQAYANYESGKREADYDMLLRIAKYFGCSADYLLGRTDYRSISENIEGSAVPFFSSHAFKTNFITLCRKIGKSPQSVCEELGLIQASKIGWNESTMPHERTLTKIADYFGVTPESLLKLEDDRDYSSLILTDAEKELLSLFRSTTESGRFEMIAACVNIKKEVEKKKDIPPSSAAI